MKALKLAIMLTLLSFVGKVEGAQTALTNFVGFGNLQVAIQDYFVTNSEVLETSVGQQKDDGSYVRLKGGLIPTQEHILLLHWKVAQKFYFKTPT